jgi:FKBP-type peptidyl-prolyl cis-trans isomerase SlpA
MSDNKINSQSQVTLHYSIAIEDGTVVDSTREDDSPVEFNMEDDVLVDGLKDAITGMKQGDKELITLSPDQTFGYKDTDNIHNMPRSDFSDDMEIEPGAVIGFETPSGDEIPGMIIELNDEEVTVDFNHPLAGHQISFDVEILKVSND